ncbi:MAG TPA: hypothetical protein ENH40_05350 [Nitrospirae bacterium]|nr:hypothetical protein [Nitrospirota bacterium]
MRNAWDRVVKLIGYDNAEKIREEFKDEEIRVPVKPPKTVIVPLIKDELKTGRYEEIAKKYNLSIDTVRRYEKWQVFKDKIVSPTGRVYPLLA